MWQTWWSCASRSFFPSSSCVMNQLISRWVSPVSCLYLTDSKMKLKLNPPPPPLCDAGSYQMRVWREGVGLGEHLCRLITSLTSAPTIPGACMLQRSMYTSTKPLFTSSSSQLFTFIYLSLFFICRSHHRWPLALWVGICFSTPLLCTYLPTGDEICTLGDPCSPLPFLFAVMALSKAQSCPRWRLTQIDFMCSSSAWLPPVLHLSFQIDSIFHMKHSAEWPLPRHTRRRCATISHLPRLFDWCRSERHLASLPTDRRCWWFLPSSGEGVLTDAQHAEP